MKYIFLTLVGLSVVGNAYALCSKYEKLVKLGAMSSDMAEAYCEAEAIRTNSSLTFRKETSACHNKYDGSDKLSGCLDLATKKFQGETERMQTVIRNAEKKHETIAKESKKKKD